LYRMLIGCLMFVSAASFADVPQQVDRTSPRTSFATHKTADAFVRCVVDASRSEFPASRVESRKSGQIISVRRAPDAGVVAVIDFEDASGGVGMVTVQTASRAQPERDPAAKIARNCQ
jgi:hypothetical protein